MSKKVILRGTTEALDSGIGGKSSVEVQGGLVGGAGGTATVAGMLTNLGVIHLHGGTGAKAGGGVLLDSGQLHNFGSLLIGAGHEAGGLGATLIDSGALSNAGMIAVGGDALGGGGVLSIVAGGVLSNAGSITLQGGGGYGGHGVTGARLDDSGKLVNSGVITIEAGETAGSLSVEGALTNAGVLSLAGGTGQYGANGGPIYGGILTNSGMLANSGRLLIGGADHPNPYRALYAGRGATLLDIGTLSNTGTIVVGSSPLSSRLAVPADTSVRSPPDQFARVVSVQQSTAGLLDVSGALTNFGMITIQGGPSAYQQTTAGAMLVDSGVLTNAGAITVGAGANGGAYDGLGQGGTLAVTGVLVNTGDITLLGAAADYLYEAELSDGDGAALNNAGMLTNAGSIIVGYGGGGYIGYRLASFASATLTDSGILVNTGVISVEARPAKYHLFDVYDTGGEGGRLIVTGTLTNDGVLTLDGSPGSLGTGATLLDSGVVTNAGTIDVGGSGDMRGAALLSLVAGGVLTNSGTINVAGMVDIAGGMFDIATTGLLTVTSGAVAGSIGIEGMLTNQGTLSLAGSTAQFDSTKTANQSAILTNAGVLDNSGTLLVGANYYNVQIPYPTVVFGGHGATLHDAGTLSSSGTIVVGAARGPGLAGAFARNGAVTKPQFAPFVPSTAAILDVSGVLTNSGTIFVQGGVTFYYYYGPGSQLIDSGTLVNSGTITVSPGFDKPFGPHGSGTITVLGLLSNTGSINLLGALAANYEYNGVYVERSGAVLSNEGVLINSGIITIAGGGGGYGPQRIPEAVLLDSGTLENTGSIVVQAGPANALGGYLEVTGVLDNMGMIALQGGSVGYLGAGTGGTVVDAGVLSNIGTITIGSGILDTYYGTTGTGSMLLDTGALINLGTILIGAGVDRQAYSGGTLIDSGQLTNAGTIDIGGGNGAGIGLLGITATGVLIDTGTVGGEGTLSNLGVITNGGAETGSIAASYLVNDGSIEVDAGIFIIDSAITADPGDRGTINLAGGTLTLNGKVSPHETVQFLGSATLAFGAIHTFNGVLDGLSSNTVLDIVGATATAVSATGTVLSIGFANGSSADLTLGAPLGGLTPHLAGDGHGGTDIIFGAASALVSGAAMSVGAADHGVSAAEAPVMGMARLGGLAASPQDDAHPWLWLTHPW